MALRDGEGSAWIDGDGWERGASAPCLTTLRLFGGALKRTPFACVL